MQTSRFLHSLLLVLALGVSAQADTLINTFDSPFDYVANGIVGDTNWDGVYLRFGDIPGGSAGGSGNGNTVAANSTVPFPGFLNLQNAGGDWSGGDDDGFFLYKVVSGDFDVSVESVPGTLAGGVAFDNQNYNFAGLQVRAYHTNNSGAPFSTTLTNNAENSLRLWRFNEFNIDGQIRVSTNGANGEYTYGPGNDSSGSRFYRIVRQNETNFTFFVKTNAAEEWFQITNNATPSGVLRRADWAGVKLQVGIAHAAFNTAARDAIFDNFQLSGPGVTLPQVPSAPASLVTTVTNTGGALTFSWSTNGGDGSLVVMSLRPIQHSPVNGITYNASSTFGDPNAFLGGSGECVVYNGPATSVTVTNLGANNLTYYVAVYSYLNNPSPIYNVASPAVRTFVGPGIITSASVVAPVNSIPLNGAVKLSLIASFSTGEKSDQSAATTWSSSDATIAGVNLAGVVSGMTTGAVSITATFGPFTSSTNITVRDPVFTDTFTTTNDYVAAGLIGTPYDGLFLKFGDVPGAVAAGDGQGSTITLDSQISSTNGLFMSSVQSTWQSTGNDGPFLYKIVPGSANSVSGDFSAALHINTMNTLNGVFAGLMARLYNPANHGPGPAGAEYHVNYWKQQNGATTIRRTQNGGGGGTVQATGGIAANGWLLLQRTASTNFYFFEKAALGDSWMFVTNIVLAAASNNAPMEVGIAQQSTAGVNALTTFDSFMLDAAGVVSATARPAPAANLTMTLNPNLSMTISYTVPANADGTAVRSVVVMRDGGPVTAQPYTGMGLGGNSVFGDANNSLGDGNYVVYRSPSGSQNTNQSVTVTGLIPGHTYYAAAYTFVGSAATRTFNNDATTANSSLQDGVLESLEALPTPPIPRGGIGFVQVLGHYTGGAILNVSPFATITSDNTNVVKVLNGVLTGITNGTANVRLIYSGVTNDAVVTVRDPSFVDEFEVNRNYLAGGLAGSGWDGLYSPDSSTNPIPSSPYVPLAGSGATVADANITGGGLLTITAAGDGWEDDGSGGFFLFRYVPGDFQMSVRIQSYEVAAYNQPGLLARAYGVDGNGVLGAPLGVSMPNANGTNDLGEYWVSFCRFDEFGIGTYARRNLDSAVSQNTQPDPAPGDTNYWLLIVRSGETEFDFYKRATETDAWRQVPNKTHYSLAQFAGRPMQAGIMAGPWTGAGGTTRTVQFERFMLDETSGSRLGISITGGNAVLSWPAIPNVAVQATSSLAPAQWQPAPGTPVLGPNGYTLSVPLGTGPMFFRLVQ